MTRYLRVLPVLIGLAATGGPPAAADPPEPGVIKERAGYLPVRRYVPLPGKVVGILLADGKDLVALDGWSGPGDMLVFSSGGNSYRKVYVPTSDNPQVTNFQVPVGDKGMTQVYPALNLANPRSVIPWGITAPFTLVEATVNSGMGGPAVDCFVATEFKVLDGTKEFPLRVADVVADLKKRYAEHVKALSPEIEKVMGRAAAQFLNGQKPTGPREQTEWMYLTWLPAAQAVQIRFKTRVSDGAYTIKEGPDLKLPPIGPPKGLPGNGVPFGGAFIGPRPGGGLKVKTGTMIGVEFGRAYEVNKQGQVLRIDDLTAEPFTLQINTTIPMPGPVPLPPGKLPPPVPPKASGN
jgi:hypothetical protein